MTKETLLAFESEFVPNKDITDVRVSNEKLLEAFTQERIHELRANVFSLLSRNGALTGSVSWAIFRTAAKAEDGSTITAQPDKETLLMVFPDPGKEIVDGHQVPSIRIITNERCVDINGETQCLGVDFTLDSDNDVQYLIDAACPEDLGQTTTPLFWVNSDGDLRYTPNFQTFTPVGYVTGEINGEQQICLPFGHFESSSGTIQALVIGQGLFNDIEFTEPSYSSQVS